MKTSAMRSPRKRPFLGPSAIWRSGTFAVAAASLLVGLLGFASAAASGAETVGSGASPALVSNAAQASDAVAGYYATPGHAFASASATFVVPTVTCPSTLEAESFGLNDQNPINPPSDVGVAAAVFVECSDGAPSYYYWAAIGKEGTTEPGINAGDTVEVSLYQTGSIEEPKVFDITKDHYWDAYTSPVPDSSVSIGVFPYEGFAKFSKVSFTQVQVNGQYLSFEPNVQYDLLSGATTLAKTSAVPTNGDSFSVKFKAAS
jgi:hypothetical protein